MDFGSLHRKSGKTKEKTMIDIFFNPSDGAVLNRDTYSLTHERRQAFIMVRALLSVSGDIPRNFKPHAALKIFQISFLT